MAVKKNDHRCVLITGCLSDIGCAMAKEFALAGYAIVVNYRRNPDQAERFVEILIKECRSPLATAIQADIRFREEARSLFEKAYQVTDRLDVLVNNAGINKDRSFLEMTDETWNIVISTILGGTFMCSQEFARRYPGSEGNIINIGAVTAIKGRKNGVNYCSARAGVLALTKCMALELAPTIRVNTITPGRIDTQELRGRYKYVENDTRAEFEKDIPMKKLGTPEDVAKMALFLTESGKYITGQNFFVDGGLVMH